MDVSRWHVKLRKTQSQKTMHSSKLLINGIVITTSADFANNLNNNFNSLGSNLAEKVMKLSKTIHGHKNAYFLIWQTKLNYSDI